MIRDVLRAPVGTSTARAILMQHFGALTAFRPYDWGRHYCPTFRRDLAELDAICGGNRLNSFEWMVPATTAKLGPKLTEFFNRIKDRDYLAEARRLRDIAVDVRNAGVLYAGFVDADGTARILQSARAATEMWNFGAGQSTLLHVNAGTPNAGLGDQTKSCQPYSPLFHVPLDRATLLQQRKLTDATIPFLKAP